MGTIKQQGHRLLSFLYFQLHAKSRKGYGIHSPFVFHLVTEVLGSNPPHVTELEKIEQLRQQLAGDNRSVELHDLGAGHWNHHPRIKDLIKRSVSSPRKLRALFKIAHYVRPEKVIELGTSLGLSALTFAKACPSARIITVEGSLSLAREAEDNFRKLEVTSIDLRIGAFEDWLPEITSQITSPFLTFIDGNHRYQATVNYFNAFATWIDTRSCIIIDDIHWSAEMEKAWHEICLHPKSTFCLDFFDFGIIFYRMNSAKSHYYLRY